MSVYCTMIDHRLAPSFVEVWFERHVRFDLPAVSQNQAEKSLCVPFLFLMSALLCVEN